ncbi:MAG: DMT family transporter [Pseudomonadota bacterium]|nr:DMT family transporter [Pseudomonadota bacterium]
MSAPPPSATAGAGQQALRGIGLLLLAEMLFAVMDTIAKYLGADLPVPMVVWGRYAFHLGFMLMLFPGRRLLPLLRVRRLGLTLLRGVLLLTATLGFFTAITHIPLADAVAIGFAAPLFVVALSIPILSEKVGARRWTAVVVGFIGVMIIVRPGFADVHWAYFLMVFLAFVFAIFVIVTRLLTRTEATLAMLFYTALMGTLGASLLLPFFWLTPSWPQVAWMAAMGALGGVSHMLMIQAYRHADTSSLAPFQYAQIIFAGILGYLVFNDLPDMWVLAGGAIVVASGTYVFHREAQIARAGKERTDAPAREK